eukprot:138437-Rhodomonas_salina.3
MPGAEGVRRGLALRILEQRHRRQAHSLPFRPAPERQPPVESLRDPVLRGCSEHEVCHPLGSVLGREQLLPPALRRGQRAFALQVHDARLSPPEIAFPSADNHPDAERCCLAMPAREPVGFA